MSRRKIQVEDLREFVTNALMACHTHASIAKRSAAAIVDASLHGIDTHGLELLPYYLDALERRQVNGNPTLRVHQTAPSLIRLDADNTLGHAACDEGADHAIALARKTGIAMVSISHSNHCGALSYYARKIAQAGQIGIIATNASANMLTPGSTRPYLGVNPLCFAAPAKTNEIFCFDLSMTEMTMGTLRQAKQSGGLLTRLAADQNGNHTNDAKSATQLLPIAGYKGFGLALMVEILTSALAGGPAGREIIAMFGGDLQAPRNLSQFVLAIDPDLLGGRETFLNLVEGLIQQLRAEPLKEASQQIIIAGDPERAKALDRSQHGIPLSQNHFEIIERYAAKLSLKMPPLS